MKPNHKRFIDKNKILNNNIFFYKNLLTTRQLYFTQSYSNPCFTIVIMKIPIFGGQIDIIFFLNRK